MQQTETRPGALSDLVVLDLTRVVAGPFCGSILGDMGARVIKIENPKGGDDSRAYGPYVNGESAYFALRLALADLLCKEEKLPLILDESFAHTDDNRTKQMLRILMALAAEDTQSLVLTCHTREEKIADTVGAYNLIEL